MVYLLKFSKRIGGPRHFASFYLGYCNDRDGALQLRLSWHRRGLGARITAAAVAQGCELELVRTWPGYTRKDERRLKNRKNHRLLV
jgi:hypothetical protein